MFRKLAKCFLSLTIVSGIIATIYYFNKYNTSEDTSKETTSEEMDSFHLDSDLEPITKRDYVPLNLNKENEKEETE